MQYIQWGVYISKNNTNPSQTFGGTWVAFGSGKTIVGVDTSQTEFNTVEKSGGEKTHTLTVDEMPSHNHNIYIVGDKSAHWDGIRMQTEWSYGQKISDYVQNTGGNYPHNNLQPYITVYMRKSTT